MADARTASSWDLVARNIVINRTLLDDTAEDISVTYRANHNGALYATGSLAWEAHGYSDAWVDRLILPATPGILVAVVTVIATIDGEVVIGKKQASKRVIA